MKLSGDRMNEIVRAILEGEGPDPSMPKEELEFWHRASSSIAARPPGLVVDIPSDSAVDADLIHRIVAEKKGKKK